MVTKERVLVVDDEPQVLVALEDLLSDDFTVVKTESAETAFTLATQAHDIAVVISDQRMPKMNGDQLFARLDGKSDALRILVTGFADLSAVVSAVNNGRIFAYVTKPWNAQDLRLLVHKGAEYFRLAQELAYERRLLHDLMHNIPDGIYFKDQDLRFLRVNRASAELMNAKDPDAMVGRRLGDVASDLPYELIENEERRVLTMGKPVLDTVREYWRHGKRSWFSESKAPIKNPAGETIGLVGISRDVTRRLAVEEALRTSEERLFLTFQASAAGLFDWNISTGEISLSSSFGMLLGEADIGWSEPLERLRDRVHPLDLPILTQSVSEHLRNRTPFNNVEVRVRVQSGKHHWFLASGQAVWDENGVATRLAGSITDITERKEQAERIERLTRIHAVLGAISSAIVRISDRGELLRESCRIAVEVGQLQLAAVTEVNVNGNERLVTWEKSDNEFMARMSTELANGSNQNGLVQRLVESKRPIVINDLDVTSAGPRTSEMLAHGYRALAILPLVADGRVECAFSLYSEQYGFFDSEEVTLLTELASNISFALEHVAQLERLNFLAHHDGTTGLPNRDLLTERMALRVAAGETARKFALVLVDVGRFGQVNETLGRRGGDDLLIHVAKRLTAAVRPGDTLARIHGNTFAVLMGAVDDESDVALFVEERLQGSFKHPFTINETELRISARAGISLFPSDGSDPDVLIRNAEAAVRNAKSSGQRYMFYAPTMNARVAEKLTLETKLRRAIDNQEFILFYQPKVELKNGTIVGLEALIRWRDPEVGLVPPGKFIPVLEDTGLIVEVGQWVLAHAAEQYTKWVAARLAPPRIAVNVSALQLARADFVASLERTIAASPLAAEGVDLEITESVFVDNLTGNTEKLTAARERGLRVAIDDFGTGYSSLGYVSRLPIDALKIDRSFVIRMMEDPHDTAIVTTIIALAHALDLKVVAEGVETMPQAQLLRLLKCDEMQGFLAAKPQPPDEVARLLGTTLLNVRGTQSAEK